MSRTRSLRDTQTFFASRAAGWETRFPHDGPAFAQAVAELAPPVGGMALDLGCGTGRALVSLREMVGPTGRVLGLDVTPEMLQTARGLGRDRLAALLLADVVRLPMADALADAVFAGGLLPHLDDPRTGLMEMARVTRVGGRLAVFHPIGRVALAARHGGVPTDDDVIAPGRLTALLAETGWRVLSIDDSEERYLTLAERVS